MKIDPGPVWRHGRLHWRAVVQVVDVIEKLFSEIFTGIEEVCQVELQAVQQQFPFEPFVMKPMRFTFAEAVKVCKWPLALHDMITVHSAKEGQSMQMLQENGFPDHSPLEDINTTHEKVLGKVIKDVYGTDFYTITEFPVGKAPEFVRPFYTMVSPTNSDLTNSFDVFMRGEVQTHDSSIHT